MSTGGHSSFSAAKIEIFSMLDLLRDADNYNSPISILGFLMTLTAAVYGLYTF